MSNSEKISVTIEQECATCHVVVDTDVTDIPKEEVDSIKAEGDIIFDGNKTRVTSKRLCPGCAKKYDTEHNIVMLKVDSVTPVGTSTHTDQVSIPTAVVKRAVELQIKDGYPNGMHIIEAMQMKDYINGIADYDYMFVEKSEWDKVMGFVDRAKEELKESEEIKK